MEIARRTILGGATALFWSDAARAADPEAEDLNGYILQAVRWLSENRKGLGYHANGVFCEDLQYGEETLRASAQYVPQTMCVSAVAEIVIRAIQFYALDTQETLPFREIPGSMWVRARPAIDIRPWLFRSTAPSNGIADTLNRYPFGEALSFGELKPGDIIYFNRTRSGHACIFLGYLKGAYEETPAYSSEVTGFRYFSSQSSHKPGFDERWAYFRGAAPPAHPEKIRDYGILRSSNPTFLNAGRIWAPSRWRVQEALLRYRAEARQRARDIVAAQSMRVEGFSMQAFQERPEAADRLFRADQITPGVAPAAHAALPRFTDFLETLPSRASIPPEQAATQYADALLDAELPEGDYASLYVGDAAEAEDEP